MDEPVTRASSEDSWCAAALTTADLCWDGMAAVLGDLSDTEVNTKPDISGANSIYAIVHHCVEMTRWWLGTFACGLNLPRDRAAEFSSRGTAAELDGRVAQTRVDAREWTDIMLNNGIVGREARGTTADVDLATVTPQWVLLHVVHELAQHLGQIQITRDMIRVPAEPGSHPQRDVTGS